MIVLVVTLGLSQPVPAGEGGRIVVHVTGLKSQKGKVIVALSKPGGIWPPMEEEEAFKGVEAGIKDHQARAAFEDLTWGEYALAAFHDENNNDRLDRNALGIPREDYGFSNNVRGFLGPPDFGKAKVSLDSRELVLEIKLN